MSHRTTQIHLVPSSCLSCPRRTCSVFSLTPLSSSGVVSGEMFRNMQNSEIIRRMTEEFDEVIQLFPG